MLLFEGENEDLKRKIIPWLWANRHDPAMRIRLRWYIKDLKAARG